MTLGANTAQFEQGMRRAQMTARSTGQNIERAMGGVSARVSQSFAGIRVAVAGLGLAMGGAALVQYARGALEFASSLSETARSIGVTVEQLQILQRAAIENGASVEGMERAMSILNRTLGQARAGVPAAVQAFRALRIDPSQFASAGQILPRVMEAIRGLATESEQAAAAQRLMGRGAAEMIPFLVQGAAGYNRAAEAARAAGLMTAEQAARADEAKDKIDALLLSIRTWTGIMITDLIPDLQHTAAGLRALFDPLAEGAERSFQRVQIGMGSLSHSISLLLHEFQNAMNFTGTAMEGAVDFLDQGLGRRLLGDAEYRRTHNRNTFADRYDQSVAAAARADAQRNQQRMTSAPADTGTRDLDLSTGGSRRRSRQQRTQEQAYRAFEAALHREGLFPTPLQGHRTRRQQADLYRRLGPGNAAPPGSSDHETYGAFDFSANVDRAALARAAAAAGVRLGPELVHGRPRHLHQAFSDARGQGGGEEQLARLQEEALRNQAQYDSDLRAAHIATLSAQREIATNSAERSRISTEIFDQERQQHFAAIDLSVQMGDRTEAQADALKAEYETRDQLQRQQLVVEEQGRRREENERLLQVSAEIQRDLLQGESDLATTASERRAVELRILDLAYREERERLGRIIAQSRDDVEREEARRRLAALPAQHAQQVSQTMRNTRGPLEAYLAGLPTTADRAREALQSVAVEGLQGITSGLADIITGTRKWGDVFKDVARQIIADLIKIQIEQRLIPLLSSALSSIGGFGGGGGTVQSSSWASVVSTVGSLPGRAAGGPVLPGHMYMVGEKGPELLRMGDQGGAIIPNNRMRARGDVHLYQTYKFEGLAITQEEFIAGLIATKSATVDAIRNMGRRRP